ncbi:MAG TPA: calcium-binding protein, partial [Thermomicrobiales bacterium]
MTGTTSDDTFVVDSADDTVSEPVNAGNDTIQSSVSYALRPNVERLVLTGSLNANAWANGSNAISYLVGNDGNNVFDGPGSFLEPDGTPVASLDGGSTNAFAVMSGGKGDDTYYYDFFKGGQVAENPGEGNDTIFLTHGAGTFTLPANIENAFDLNGSRDRITDGGDSFLGNALDNRIGYGGSFTNFWYYLDGGPGADTMLGSGGNDVYVVDNAKDRVVESGVYGGGDQASTADQVVSSVTYELPANVERLALSGTAAVDGWGNNLDNVLAGNSAPNKLRGGLGDDTYIVDGTDVIVERPGEGFDTVELHGTGTRTYTPADLPENVEALTLGDDVGASQLQGDGGDNWLIGNASNNVISGGAGDDDLRGGGGSDTYLFASGFGHDSIRDDPPVDGSQAPVNHVVFDASITRDDVYFQGGGLHIRGSNDRIDISSRADIGFADGSTIPEGDVSALLYASRSTTPSPNPDLFNGTDGDDRFDALAGNDFLYGNGGNDDLAGGADDDRLNGGAGDDSLAGGSGNDRIYGDAGNDALAGNEGYDTLDGGAGDDALDGGEDNDTLLGGTGRDTLRGGATGHDELHGGDDDDTLIAGSDPAWGSSLYGENGKDTLIGGLNNDTLDGGSEDDLLQGFGGDDYLIGQDGNDVLQGGEGVDVLNGANGDDSLDGGPGDDTLSGGPGDDWYVLKRGGGRDFVAVYGDDYVTRDKAIVAVDAGLRPSDVAITMRDRGDGSFVFSVETNDGIDGIELEGRQDPAFPVEVHFSDGTVWDDALIQDKLHVRRGTAGPDVLNADPWGSQLFGFAGNDTLSGGIGSDVLDGGTGADAMTGGGGADVYIVDDPGDLVTGGASRDTVQSSVGFVAQAAIEDVMLTGSAAIDATGNALVNRLTGNAGNNVLDGKAGGDTLTGGAGDDTYRVDSAL